MEPLEFRYGGGRILFELLMLAVAVGIGAVLGRELLENRPDAALVEPAAWAAFVWAAGLLAVFRWRLRVVIDRDGIALRRSRTWTAVRLDWDEIDEVFLLGPVRFEVRGAGKSLVFSNAFHDGARARQRVSAKLGALRDRLRNRALQDGELEFRMPTSRLAAHVAYLLAILVLTGLTLLALAPFFRKGSLGFPFLIVLFGGSWLWSLRRAASGLGTRVTLYRDGLLIRRLDGRDRVAWSDVASTEWDEKGRLVLVREKGKPIGLPGSLANIAILEEFVEESREAAAGRP